MKELLSGNEALARGALEAGIEIACGYPGTPSSEILENVAKYKEIYSEWSVNEKVAMDAAAGAAYSGRRSMVTTKQVGMNVLSDSLFYTAYTAQGSSTVLPWGMMNSVSRVMLIRMVSPGMGMSMMALPA